MSSTPITVVARITARPGLEEELQRKLLALIPLTRCEEGCIMYRLHRSTEIPGLFLFYENWRSRRDLDDHLATPYLQEFLGQADRLLAAPVELTFWEEIE
jgi:quinol monooxygenase YgiN